MLGYFMYKLKIKFVVLIAGLIILGFYSGKTIINYYTSETNLPVLIWWTPFTGDVDTVVTCYEQYNCLLTKNRTKYNSTKLKAFLFYGSNFEITDLPVPKKDIWALFHEESPRNSGIFLFNRTYELFNITATFSRYSDFPLTLQYLKKLSIITDTQYVVSVQQKNKLLDSIAPVLYLQSDCDTPNNRDAYVMELMKYIKVDSYGACLNNKQLPQEVAEIEPLDLYNYKLLRVMAKYKFIIAFENAICEDYITEKLWRPLYVGTIPIYLGSPSVQDWLPNVNSAILAKDFPTPKALATFINKINNNTDLYMQFLAHKYGQFDNIVLQDVLNRGFYGLPTEQKHPIPGFECYVCRALYNGVEKRKTNTSMYDCAMPSQGNGWIYHWKSGDCKSKALVDFVKHNKKLDTHC